MIIDIVKIFLPSLIAFIVGIAFTPFLTDYLYRNEMWKKKSGKIAPDGRATPLFNELHKHKEVGTPKMGGTVIWVSSVVTIIGIWIISQIIPTEFTQKLDFLSRNQTWIPLFTLLVGALIGLFDDWMEVSGTGDHIAGGLSLKKRILIVFLIGLLCGSWFYFRLNVDSLGMPAVIGNFYLGAFFIPFFAFVMVALYSGGIIDGLDGLAGGIFASMFAAYAGIAFYQQQINLAAFCTMLVGGILAFLWFNIPPARYYMSETGTMALTITLAVVAFMTDALAQSPRGHYGVLVLPIIAMPLLITSLSDIIQLTSKKLRNGKKVFLIAPIHHHFEALGWPAYKVTMRFWIVSIICAIAGMILALVG